MAGFRFHTDILSCFNLFKGIIVKEICHKQNKFWLHKCLTIKTNKMSDHLYHYIANIILLYFILENVIADFITFVS